MFLYCGVGSVVSLCKRAIGPILNMRKRYIRDFGPSYGTTKARDRHGPLGPRCPVPFWRRLVSRCIRCYPMCEGMMTLGISFIIPMCLSEIPTDSRDLKHGIIMGSLISSTYLPISTTDHFFHLHKHSFHSSISKT